ncbi:MAG: hypothetical protein FD135_1418 [Comamonadaceae bacterium]|nr:MAG: hypothetical protein FD135_1418 [Comamonadaceae bacterium]
MNPSLPPTYPISNDLVALQRLIQQLAQRCGFDLNNRVEVQRLLDGDFSRYATPDGDRASYQELRTMLTLQLRLETSSGEDIGIHGLNFLWHQCSDILKRCRVYQLA